MQGMGTFRLGRRTVMYTVETIPKGKNRVLGTIQIMTGFIHISFGIILSTLTSVYTSFFVSGEIPFLGGASVKGSQAMNIISAIFALLGILAFIVDLSINGPFHSDDSHQYSLVMTGNRIAIVLLTFTVVEFCIASATAYFWCRATRSDSNEAILIEPNAIRTDTETPSVAESSRSYPPNSNDVNYDPKVETV
ncbi:membrane-spanning 4-domains subfamily A member 15 isoform X2 [Anolis carolinensis]|uniref:membrane-spanning 4-domains subfamily A member 15 isoform X2 n=1 Tax=Anolis carolinensis TaxID=28377 RepID=UPI000462D426|nr:PREDICTED: membrane-spanning 4-domains subfamily A member 15 isoform X2 [Anolis carolinensis]|eukprot:XP_016851042.1 PREDICTED: membrane-spanning 4-domains subfamily A member 15 isoform X2 [Anolis carolinensis]